MAIVALHEIPPRRRLLYRGMAMLVGLFLALLLLELGLRLVGVDPSKRGRKQLLVREKPFVRFYCYNSNPNGELSRRPDISKGKWKLFDYNLPPTQLPLKELAETPWCVEEKVNSGGHRDREYTKEPAPGVLRIAGIGDSFANGEGVPLHLSLFKQMERELGEGYEVINGARPGVSTAAEVPQMFNLVRDYQCTRTIVIFIINDVESTEELRRRVQTVNDMINIREPKKKTLSARRLIVDKVRVLSFTSALLSHSRVRGTTIQWYHDLYDEKLNGPNLRHLSGAFGTMSSAVPNNRTVMVIYPLIEGLKAGYPFKKIHKKVKAMAEDTGLPVLDLAPVFSEWEDHELQVHPVDHHPNGRAHKIAAKFIVMWLKKVVPKFLERPKK